MSRDAWETIKSAKSFYVTTFRRASKFLVLSMFLNILLGLGIAYFYLHQPKRQYFATNGITLPVELTALNSRNYSSEALLPPDPVSEIEVKAIPQ